MVYVVRRVEGCGPFSRKEQMMGGREEGAFRSKKKGCVPKNGTKHEESKERHVRKEALRAPAIAEF